MKALNVDSAGATVPPRTWAFPKIPSFRRKRASPALSAAAPETPHLKFYTEEKNAPSDRRLRRWALTALLVFSLLQGFLFAVFAPYLITLFFVVPAVLLLLVIWALPETSAVPTKFMERCFFGYFIALIVWPNYLAVALPGLPWITLTRLMNLPMVFAFAVALSQSSAFRREMGTLLSPTPWLWRVMLAFLIIMLLTLPLSPVIGLSVQKIILVIPTWFAVYLVSAYAFKTPGRPTRWFVLICSMTMFLGLIAVWESRLRHVPWAFNIPSFLRIEDPSVLATLHGGGRDWTNIYRAQTTFPTALGFGEFIAIATPFFLHAILHTFRLRTRVAAAVGTCFLVYVALLSGSRSATLGGVISIVLTFGVWGVMRWRRLKGDLLGPAAVMSFPIAGVAAIASTLLVGRLHQAVWGGGETVSSTLARYAQWDKGIPLILKRPWGHGIGSSATVLDYHLPGGLLVIDSGFLVLLLDFGILGFLAYVGMLFTGIGYAARTVMDDRSDDGEILYLIPISIALFTWFVVKLVCAEDGNNPIIFMFLGMITALTYRHSKQRKLALDKR